jgi:hypothetical protein
LPRAADWSRPLPRGPLVRSVSATRLATMNSRIGPFLLAGLWSVVFIYLVLALAEAGGLAACHWAFPRWFGCVLYVHESLAAGLIAAAGALTAAWIAWTAVQQQINAEKERTTADRRDGPRGE